nr:3-oxoacyl-ACP reductase family protein [Thomasclavelia sp.]
MMKKVVLITGGARGIGKAIALELAKHGYDIVVNYLTSKQDANTLKKIIIEKYGVRCLAIQADVSKEDEVDKMISLIEDKLGGVDILVNNAAIDLSNLFHLKNANEFRKTLDVNVVGAFNCSKRVYRRMLEKEYGRIINISSTNGINTYYPMCIDYDASKAALISLTHNLAFEYAPYINVNCIAPGFIGTENELDGYDEQFLQEEIEKIMVNRYGDPKEVAYLVKFLISDEANFINNTVIRIDGGQKGSC